MNMISEIRRRVSTTGAAVLTADEYNRLQREWITRMGAEGMIAKETEHVCSTGELEDITKEEFRWLALSMYGAFSLRSLNLEQIVAVANAALRYKLSANTEVVRRAASERTQS